MLVPTTRAQRFFDPFDFGLFPSASAETTKTTNALMKTDIKETEKAFELHIELPGFKKEQIQAEIKDGYLTVTAESANETEDKGEDGTFLRKERFSGKCSRSFYVGEDIAEDDITATFENGVLKLVVPKQEQPKLEEGKKISIG